MRTRNVKIILDKMKAGEQYAQKIMQFLEQSGIPVQLNGTFQCDGEYNAAHNKVIIIDSHIVITGSYNLTGTAEYKNAENLLIIKSPKLADQYTKNWNHHWNHSTEPVQDNQQTTHGNPRLEAYFSPGDSPTEAIIRELDKAKKSIRMQAYSLTHPKIIEAIISANKRGAKTDIILDYNQALDKDARYAIMHLIHSEAIVALDNNHKGAHNKVIIIDDRIVITGSFNFTKKAEKNAENLLIIEDTELAWQYGIIQTCHGAHSVDPRREIT
jgi:phosphatidylserine/phosphatidylglycerophosphate/cardiolipin synthase-like enzyme